MERVLRAGELQDLVQHAAASDRDERIARDDPGGANAREAVAAGGDSGHLAREARDAQSAAQLHSEARRDPVVRSCDLVGAAGAEHERLKAALGEAGGQCLVSGAAEQHRERRGHARHGVERARAARAEVERRRGGDLPQRERVGREDRAARAELDQEAGHLLRSAGDEAWRRGRDRRGGGGRGRLLATLRTERDKGARRRASPGPRSPRSARGTLDT